MSNSKYNLTFSPDVITSKELQIFDSESNPLDLTGSSLRLMARERRESTTLIVELSTNNGGIIITDATNGWVRIILDPINFTDTSISGVYDMEILFADLTLTPQIIKGYLLRELIVTHD